MKKLFVLSGIVVAGAFVLIFALTSTALCDDCTTIQSGELLASDGSTITVGYDEWGYNYQAHMFNGGYCDAYRDAIWCQPYKEVHLSMKWNDAWLANKDCDGDGLLDRAAGLSLTRVSRPESPAPSVGSHAVHTEQQKLLVDESVHTAG